MSRGARADEIARALGMSSETSTGFKCRCPAHEDKQASLQINTRGNGDGRPTVHCHAGCLPKAIYQAIEEATGLHFEDRELPSNRTQNKEPAVYPAPIPWSPVRLNDIAPSKSWPYFNAQGQLMFVVARYDNAGGKVIRPYSVVDRKGQPVWKSTLTLRPRPLFNLPELLKRPDAPVLYVEGEKAAMAAATLPEFAEYVVTTNSGGIKNWKHTDLAPLKNRDVRLWPDHDQAGLAGFLELGRWLQIERFANSVLVANIPDSFPDKWDLADEMPPGHTLASVTWFKAPEPDRRFKLKTITAANYMEAFDGLYYLYHDGQKTWTISKEYRAYRKGCRISPDETFTMMQTNSNHEAADLLMVGRNSALKEWINEKKADQDYVQGFGWDPSTTNDVLYEDGVKKINTFTGWAYPAEVAGSCELFKQYILDVLADGDRKAYDYIWNFLAHMIQYPAQKPTVAVLFKGDKGAGKSFFFNMLAQFLGGINGYGYIIAGTATFANGFNGHYALSRLALFVNEWEITKSRQIENIVKSFITESRVDVNIKHIRNFPANNYTRVFGATNHNHVWNASSDERRISIFHVSSRHTLDRDYFDAIDDELTSGGFNRLMYELSTAQVRIHDVMKPFQNDALNLQKEYSKTPAQEFAYTMLRRGELFLRLLDDRNEVVEFHHIDLKKWTKGPVIIPAALVSSLIAREAEKKSANYEKYIGQSKEASCKGFLEWVGGDVNARSSVGIFQHGTQIKVHGYRIPSLEDARKAYAKRSGLPYEQLFEEVSTYDEESVVVKFPASDMPF